jgi:hypothetical protein
MEEKGIVLIEILSLEMKLRGLYLAMDYSNNIRTCGPSQKPGATVSHGPYG